MYSKTHVIVRIGIFRMNYQFHVYYNYEPGVLVGFTFKMALLKIAALHRMYKVNIQQADM